MGKNKWRARAPVDVARNKAADILEALGHLDAAEEKQDLGTAVAALQVIAQRASTIVVAAMDAQSFLIRPLAKPPMVEEQPPDA